MVVMRLILLTFVRLVARAERLGLARVREVADGERPSHWSQ